MADPQRVMVTLEPMDADAAASWNLRTIRQAARVLGAQPSWVGDVQSTARAQRVVRDMLERRGFPTETFHVPGSMPLVIAGNGPILITTFLDDPFPGAQQHDGSPPAMHDNIASAPGITRKAGVLAALGALFGSNNGQMFTLAVEADRHAGSVAIERWLDRSGKRFVAGLCEAVDLPVPTPIIFPSAFGRMLVSITIERHSSIIEDTYGGVAPDLGHLLASVVATLKSSDAEVEVPGFYDTVLVPTSAEIDALDGVTQCVGTWLQSFSGANGDRPADRHNTMALFFAPAVAVRSLSVNDNGPFLPSTAQAHIDIRLTPGQQPAAVLRAVAERVRTIAPHGQVTALLSRPPVVGKLRDRVEPLAGVRIIALAPGSTPAGLLEERGTPTLGYAVVGRDAPSSVESVDLNRVLDGSSLLRSLATQLMARR